MATISIGQNSPDRPLCFDDGDVIVKLGEDTKKHLLVHKHILEVTMPPLAAAVGRWSEPATVLHPETKKEVTIYSLVLELKDTVYELVAKTPDLDDYASSLAAALDSSDVSGTGVEHKPTTVRIHQHDTLGAGLPTRSYIPPVTHPFGTQESVKEVSVQSHAVTALYMLFGMVYKTVDVATLAEKTTFRDLADIVEYAEMYMCLPLVADQIRTCLLAKQDLWQDVKQQPLFHLALAIRLSCEETFADAL